MVYSDEALKLVSALLKAGLIGAKGGISMELLGERVEGNDKSVVGYSMQGWLSQWMTNNDIYHHSPKNSQESPDFFLSADEKAIMEFKCFDASAGANFDIANFEAYLSLIENHPEHIDADYLIFSYTLVNSVLEVKELWLKKLWEITGPSEAYPIKTQIKRKVIYNIRPSSWMSSRSRYPVFGTKKALLQALYETSYLYHSPDVANAWRLAVAAKLGKDFLGPDFA